MMNDASQYSEQDRERTEEDLARGPVSRGAANQSAPSNQRQNVDPTTEVVGSGTGDNAEHYNKQLRHNDAGLERGSDRDLGTAGGGSIPGGNTYSGMNTSDDTVSGGVSPARSDMGGSGSAVDRGRANVPGMKESPGTHNAADQPQQGTLGGRNPGQTQNQPIGDQDTTFGHRDARENEIEDPMTSRAPDKVNRQSEQER